MLQQGFFAHSYILFTARSTTFAITSFQLLGRAFLSTLPVLLKQQCIYIFFFFNTFLLYILLSKSNKMVILQMGNQGTRDQRGGEKTPTNKKTVTESGQFKVLVFISHTTQCFVVLLYLKYCCCWVCMHRMSVAIEQT